MLLALKKRPQIRYNARSEMANRLAESLSALIDTEATLAFRKPDGAAAADTDRRRSRHAAA